MIARATLALMLACPSATVLLCPHGAAAQTASPNASKREKASSLNRRSRSFAHRATTRRDAPVVSTLYPGPVVSALYPGVLATYNDGLAYDTPRGPDGRGVALAVAARPIPLAGIHRQVGLASWYGGRRWQGHLTSSGTRYDENQLTAAHATLPLGSEVRVRLVGSDREVVVTITDRPGTRRRIIDLSRGAAAALGILSQGIAEVSLEPL